MAARATKQLRAKDRLALPLLYLLHLIFTLSSLILRLYQSIFGSQHEERSTKPIKQPRHVALVLAASSYSSTPDGRKAQQMAWLHSIERVEKLAMEEGVSSLSVWDNHGERHKSPLARKCDADRSLQGILRQCRMSRDPDLSFPPPPPRYNSYLDRRTRRRCSDEAEVSVRSTSHAAIKLIGRSIGGRGRAQLSSGTSHSSYWTYVHLRKFLFSTAAYAAPQ
jgi:hypothetical protein